MIAKNPNIKTTGCIGRNNVDFNSNPNPSPTICRYAIIKNEKGEGKENSTLKWFIPATKEYKYVLNSLDSLIPAFDKLKAYKTLGQKETYYWQEVCLIQYGRIYWTANVNKNANRGVPAVIAETEGFIGME